MSDFIKAVEFTVPLSVTQSEIIRNLRDWADTRAVNATPKDELVSYTVNMNNRNDMKKTDDKDEENKETKDISSTRGGRTLDF